MLTKYKKHDKYITFNEDPDFTAPIKVEMPSPPEPEQIIGYGLKPEEQKFKRPFMPPKLYELDKDRKIAHNEKAEILREDPEYYEEEIAFIQQEWNRRLNGVWYYINGKPTYIPGVFYFYLTCWYLERGYPTYRERDRLFFVFSEFCENDPYCYGFVYPKHRREGATTKAACWNYEYISRFKRARGGIQSMTDTHAGLVFSKHLVPGWRKLPFWYKPIFEGTTNPKEILSFNAPPLRITRTNMGADEMEDLESTIDYESSTEGAYDGSRLERYHGDEIGKCFVIDTPIRMYNGSIKKIQDVVNGDVVMGADSKRRTVGGIARGKEECYNIIPNQGVSFGCNKSHILSLKVVDKRGFRGLQKGDVLNISVEEYLKLSLRAQKHLVLYRTGVQYKEKKHIVNPYYLGLWLGDGTKNDCVIHNTDKEIINWLHDNYDITEKQQRTSVYLRAKGERDNLRKIGVLNNKNIPKNYLIDSQKNRLELLAGLLDSDGHLYIRNNKPSNYEITQKIESLAKEIHELALSLGFNATINTKTASMKRDDGSKYFCYVYRVNIYGDLHRIPCKVIKKKAEIFEHHKNRRNPLHTGFKVESIGEENYYGFTLKEDPLFLLGDYTVAHNTKTVNVYKRHLVARECMTYLDTIIGKAIYTSTAGEMVKGGGQQFKKLILASDYHDRDDNQRTTSGLYTLFMPADEGFKIDEFGMSLKEESRTYLLNERKNALEKEDYEKLNESTRMYPLRLRDCFRNASDQDNFDMKIIQDQLDKYQFGNDDITVGNFVWENGVVDGRVIFQPDANGRFKVSYLFHSPKESNRYYTEMGMKVPANDNRFRAGGDTFKFKVTQSGKKSLGGGAVFMKRDHSIDHDDRPLEEWETHRFVCTYLHRPQTKDEYCEDMLMMCIYYGCKMCPEINVPAIMDHFERRGYPGYLFYVFDKKTGKLKKNPGYNTQQVEREAIFREYQQLVKKHGHRIVHDDLLEQLLEIGDDMGDYDLFAGGGMALISIADENAMYYSKEVEEEGLGIDDFYDYNEY